MSEFEITIRRALRQGGYTGAIPGGQPFGRDSNRNIFGQRPLGCPLALPLVPAKAGTQASALDSRFRGNDRTCIGGLHSAPCLLPPLAAKRRRLHAVESSK